MSKRKGRRQPLTSEIKSVMRPPPGAAGELEALREESGTPNEVGDSGAPEASAVLETSEGQPSDVVADDDSLGASGVDSALQEYETALDDAAAALGRKEPELDEVEALSELESTKAPRRRRSSRPSRIVSAALDADALEPDAGSPTLDDAPRGAAPDELEDAASEDAAGEEDEAGDDDEGGTGRFGEAFSLDDIAGDDMEGFLRGLVEALLFTSQKPVDLRDLARSAGIDKPRARELIEQLQQSYEGRGLCIEEVAGGFVMRSSPRYAPYIHKILALRPVRLSRAQLETLAIIAYRQPVTKPEVDDIRGVDSGQVIKGLLERSLLKMLGKKDEPGRPTLYGTTNEFLELLSLQSLKDLPTLREYTELSEESQRKFQEATGEAAPSDAMLFERPPSGEEGGDEPAASPQPEGVDSGDPAERTGDVDRDEAAAASEPGSSEAAGERLTPDDTPEADDVATGVASTREPDGGAEDGGASEDDEDEAR